MPGVDPNRPWAPGIAVPAMPAALGIDWHQIASKVVGFLLKAWTGLLDLLGLRKPTPEQAAKAWQNTEQVMASFDPGRTGYVYGQALEAWLGREQVPMALARDDRNRDSMLDRMEIQGAFERQAMEAAPILAADVNLPASLRGGARIQAQVFRGPALAPGQTPSMRVTVNVGPEVVREVEQQAYALACQAIATRQLPDLSVPDLAKQALARWGAGNTNGQANGAIAINLDEPAFVEAVRAGITRAAIDTPLRRHCLRPEGMARLRMRLVNSGIAQRVIVKQVDTQFGQVQRQLETLANGVVVFQDLPVGQTGARVAYVGDGYVATLDALPADMHRLLFG